MSLTLVMARVRLRHVLRQLTILRLPQRRREDEVRVPGDYARKRLHDRSPRRKRIQ